MPPAVGVRPVDLSGTVAQSRAGSPGRAVSRPRHATRMCPAPASRGVKVTPSLCPSLCDGFRYLVRVASLHPSP